MQAPESFMSRTVRKLNNQSFSADEEDFLVLYSAKSVLLSRVKITISNRWQLMTFFKEYNTYFNTPYLKMLSFMKNVISTVLSK